MLSSISSDALSHRSGVLLERPSIPSGRAMVVVVMTFPRRQRGRWRGRPVVAEAEKKKRRRRHGGEKGRRDGLAGRNLDRAGPNLPRESTVQLSTGCGSVSRSMEKPNSCVAVSLKEKPLLGYVLPTAG